MSKRAIKAATAPAPEFKLNLACGDHRIEGYLGVDLHKFDNVDQQRDLKQYPWPWDNEAVGDIICNYYLSFLDGPERVLFIEECWRVLKPGANVTIKAPHWMSMRAVSDPFYKWPPICETSFLVFNKAFREANKHQYYPISCDFDFAANYGYAVDPQIASRNDEYKQYAVKHLNNAVLDITITLIKRP